MKAPLSISMEIGMIVDLKKHARHTGVTPSLLVQRLVEEELSRATAAPETLVLTALQAGPGSAATVAMRAKVIEPVAQMYLDGLVTDGSARVRESEGQHFYELC